MKTQGFLILILVVAFTAGAQTNPGPALQWSETEHTFGSIEKGTPVSYTFQFTNAGESPLTLTSVKAFLRMHGSCLHP